MLFRYNCYIYIYILLIKAFNNYLIIIINIISYSLLNKIQKNKFI